MNRNRSTLLTAVLLAGLCAGTAAEPSPPPAYPDAQASDPAKLGWMQGSPPPPDRLVRHDDMSFYTFPRTRWSFANLRQLVPTVAVWRGDQGASTLPRAERPDIDTVRFTPTGGSTTMSWKESLATNYTDAILVLHRGRIVQERYFGVMSPHTPHMAMSVSKSFVGTLAAMLVHEDRLDPEATVARYIPELARSAFGDATVRQVLDMTTALDFSEDYTDQNSGIWRHALAGGTFARPPGYAGPTNLYESLQTIRKQGEHGRAFTYLSVNTDVLGWLIRRVTGHTLAEELSTRFWQPLGMEEDAYVQVDSTGFEFAAGGLNLTLRDMARFGEMLRLGGRFNGRQVVPSEVIEDIRAGASKADFARSKFSLPGWSYHDQWWITHNAHRAWTARGVHGQTIYIDPEAEMVVVRFASHPLAANSNFDPTSLPAYEALAAHLMSGD